MSRRHKIVRIVFYAHRDYVFFFMQNFFCLLSENPVKRLNRRGNRCACGFSACKTFILFRRHCHLRHRHCCLYIRFHYSLFPDFFMFCRSVNLINCSPIVPIIFIRFSFACSFICLETRPFKYRKLEFHRLQNSSAKL